jgi:hypothetical protein
MTENQEKQPLQYATMAYIGRQFVRKFNNDDGTVTKSYKYQFKDNENQQYPNNFWGYDTTKGSDMLEDGERYTIGFINKPNTQGDKPLKIARFFGKPDVNDKKPVQQTITHKPSNSNGLMTDLQGKEFNAQASTFIREAISFGQTFIDTYAPPDVLNNQAPPQAFYAFCDNKEECGTDYFINLNVPAIISTLGSEFVIKEKERAFWTIVRGIQK